MNYFLKQKPIFKFYYFFFSIIILFAIYSCCRDHDCKCSGEGEENKIEFWEHFIAHAGGAIDGINYTNCVEALDLSYSKGCKLFELDLVLTTDDKIVAKHDPPGKTEAEFMSQLISGKYTPMNMAAINNWFQEHPDAILITDKINTPERIYEEFLFRDRVIMELFAWDSVDRAIELGIKPMVSENLIYGSSKKSMEMGIIPSKKKSLSNVEQILEDKKIEYICMSRYYRMKGNENFLRRLKNKGIKNYVYHLELPVPVGGQSAEEYVWNYEMKFCHGMYANDLDLLFSLLNEQ